MQKRVRRPVHLQMGNPDRPEGRQVVWAAIRKLRRFTLLDLEHHTRINTATILTFVQGLTNAGYLTTTGALRERNERGSFCYRPAKWELVKDVGVDAPRVTKSGKHHVMGVRQQNMWRAMRILKDFSTRELQLASSTDEAPVSLEGAKDYTKHLLRAGYLRFSRKRSNYIGARYALIPARNTGPCAPMVQRVTKHVFDQNLRKVVTGQGGFE